MSSSAPSGSPFLRLAPLRAAPRASTPAPVAAALARSAGAALDAPVRGALERSMGVDLAAVRVHQGAEASALVDSLGARAFTFGADVFLGGGERRTDLALMGHEVAHVLQQQGSPALQQLGPGSDCDPLEREATQAAAAAVAGLPAPVHGRTTPRPQFLFGWVRRAARAVGSAVTAVASAVGDIAGAAMRFIRDHARIIPGYDMLALILTRDPVTGESVPRTATNVVRALMGLWPGGSLFLDALQRYGILDRAGAWLGQQVDALIPVVAEIGGALRRFVGTLGASDLLHLGDVWDRARRLFTSPIARASTAVRGFASGVLGFIRDAVLRPLATLARGTRGYDLLVMVLARDPITREDQPRTAERVIGGFMRLIGQEEKWRHLQESRAIPRAWAWFQQQFGLLMGIVREVPSRFMGALRELGVADLLGIPAAFARVGRVFLGFVGEFVTWAGNAAIQVMLFIFEALAPEAMPVLRRAGAALRTIIRDPVRFVGYLVRAGIRGFEQFRTNIRTHLTNGLVGWITGALGGAGLQLPTRWDLRGILSLALQILGLTWANIRTKLVRVMGETVVSVLENTFTIVMTLVREGPAAAWQQILEHLGNLQEMVMGQVREWVISTVVGQAVVRIASMLNPAGAVIQAIMAIYNTIQFVRTRLQQITQVADAFVTSISAIAAGDTSAAANRVEQTMGRLVPVVIGFLAQLIGLGGISDTIRNIIARIRAPVDRALDRVVDWIVAQARRLGRLIAGGVRGAARRVADWWRRSSGFTSRSGARHTLSLERVGRSAEIMVRSNPEILGAFLGRLTPADLAQAGVASAVAAIRGYVAWIDGRKGTDGNFSEDAGGDINVRFNLILGLLPSIPDATASGPLPPTTVAWDQSYLITVASGPSPGNETLSRRMTATYLSLNPGTNNTGFAPRDRGKLWQSVSRRGSEVYVRGHLLNHHLFGPGLNINLVPMSQSLNGLMRARPEAAAKRAVLDERRVVKYEVRAFYGKSGRTHLPDEGLLPSHLTFSMKDYLYRNGTWQLQDTERLPSDAQRLDHELPDNDPLPGSGAELALWTSKTSAATPRPYRASDSYRLDDVVIHTTFGVGYVSSLVPPSHVMITFERAGALFVIRLSQNHTG